MSLIKTIVLLLAAGSGVAQAKGVACPATSRGQPLSAITVFDGPPAENASLVPDTTRRIKGGEVSTWQLASIYEAGRIAYLACAYGKAKPIVVPVKRARLCRYTARGVGKSLSCD